MEDVSMEGRDGYHVNRLQETNLSSSPPPPYSYNYDPFQQRPATILSPQPPLPPPQPNKDPNLYQYDQEPTTLIEKLRSHYREGSSAGSRSKVFARVIFQFQAWTFIFMVFVYLSPFVLEEYDLLTQICVNLFFLYIFIMTQTNWLFSILVESDVPDDINNQVPQLPGTMMVSFEDDNVTSQNNIMSSEKHRAVNYTSGVSELGNTANIKINTSASTIPRVDSNGLVWKYCKICEQFRAPRTYHCKFCRKCILRRDHHCHLVGKCIGHHNQRYFVVLCFYTMLSCAIGFPVTTIYLAHLDEATSWKEYFLPYAFMLFLFRYVSWKFVLLTFHCYLLFLFGIASLLYWLAQLSLISMGKTLVEVIKQMDMKVTSSLHDNFAVVFGEQLWFLSFLFPLQAIFRQTHDGIHFQGVKIYGKKEEKL